MKFIKLSAVCAASALAISLTACTSSDPGQGAKKSLSENTSVSSSENLSKDKSIDSKKNDSKDKEKSDKSSSTSKSSDNTSADSASKAPASSGSVVLKDLERTELSLNSKLPDKVETYIGQEAQVITLAHNTSIARRYKDPDTLKEMTVSTDGNLTYEEKAEFVKGDVRQLGKIGMCGDLNGIKGTPTCNIRLEGNMQLNISGSYNTTLDEVIDFTTEMLNLM